MGIQTITQPRPLVPAGTGHNSRQANYAGKYIWDKNGVPQEYGRKETHTCHVKKGYRPRTDAKARRVTHVPRARPI